MTYQRPKLENIPVVKMLKMGGFQGETSMIEDCSVGLLNNVYKIGFKGEVGKIVLRVRTFIDPEYGQEPIAERYAYHLVSERNINVPELYFHCVDESRLGYKFSIFECVDGPTMDTFLTDHEVADDQKIEILKNLGKSLARVHQIKGSGFGTLTSQWNSADQRSAFWSQLFGAEVDRLKDYKAESAKKYKDLIPFWMEQFAALPASLGDPRLVHGDIHGRNIIVKDETTPVLIDWEASRFRIAPYDFAQISYLNLRRFPEGYDHLLDSYCQEIPDQLDKQQLKGSIKLCEFFWQLRMGLFLRHFPSNDEKYFGSADDHLTDACQFIEESYEQSRLVKKQVRRKVNEDRFGR